MREPIQPWTGDRSLRLQLPLMGWVSVVVVLILVGVPGFYFALMVLLVGFLGGLITVAFALLAILCFLSVVGTILCASGIIMRTSAFKCLSISLSVLGIIPLPLIAFSGQVDAETLMILAALAGWGALLLLATLTAFSYISTMSRKHEPNYKHRHPQV
jgi:hypothetical protein